jgi:hypothetical protein
LRIDPAHLHLEFLKRLKEGKWPAASVVGELFGSWQEARGVAAAAARTDT